MPRQAIGISLNCTVPDAVHRLIEIDRKSDVVGQHLEAVAYTDCVDGGHSGPESLSPPSTAPMAAAGASLREGQVTATFFKRLPHI